MKNIKFTKLMLAMAALGLSYGTASAQQNAEIAVDKSDIEVCGDEFELSVKDGTLQDGCRVLWSSTDSRVSFSNNTAQSTTVIELPKGELVYIYLKTFLGDNELQNKDEITIKNIQPETPTITNKTANQICGGDIDLEGSTASDQLGKWSTKGKAEFYGEVTSQNVHITNLEYGDNKFVWSVYYWNHPECVAEASTMITYKVDLGDLPSQEYTCDGEYNLVAEYAEIQNGRNAFGVWSKVDGSCTTAENLSTCNTIVSGIAPNSSVKFKWTVYKENCSESKDIQITYNEVTANAGADAVTDEDSYFLEADALPDGYSGCWSIVSKDNISKYTDFDDPSDRHSTICELLEGKTTLRWTVTDGHCTAFDDVDVTYIPQPVFNPSEICGDGEISVTAPPAGYFGCWSCSNDAVKFNSSTDPTTTVSGIPTGASVTLKWNVYADGTVPDPATPLISFPHDITNNNPKNFTFIGIPTETCRERIDLNVTAPGSSETGVWYLVTNDGREIPLVTYNNLNVQLLEGENKYKWVVTKGECSKSETVKVTYTVPTVVVPEYVCGGEAEVSVKDIPSGVTGYWELSNSVSGVTIDDYENTTTTIHGIPSGGTLNLKWNYTDKYKEQFSISRDITNVKLETPTISSATNEVCKDNIELSGSLNPGMSGYWTTTGNAVFANGSASSNVRIENLPKGDNEFFWSVFMPGHSECVSTASTMVTYNSAEITAPSETCNESVEISVSSSGFSGYWDADNSSVTFDNNTAYTTTVTGLPVGEKVKLYWHIIDGPTVEHEITNNALRPEVKTSTVHTTNSRAVITAMTPPEAATSYHWEDVDRMGAVIENSAALETKVRNLHKSANKFKFVVENEKCSAFAEVTVNNDSIDKSLTETDIEITLSNTSYTYTGAEFKPEVTVMDGTEQLIPNTDYKITYADNTNAGTAKAIITGQDFYSGTVEKEFTIAKVPLTVTAKDNTVSYGSTPDGFESTITGFVNDEDETVLAGTLEYERSYKPGDNVGEYTVTPKGLTSANYEITYVAGKLTVTPLSMENATVELAIAQLPYTGEPLTPALTVALGSTTLAANTDYTVEYADNVNVGTAKATITGKGNYTGTVEKEFTIVEPTVPTLSFDTERSYIYTGSPIEPEVAVLVGGEPLSATYYTVTYTDNVNAGVGKIKVESKEDTDLEFSFDATFAIAQADITTATATLAETTVEYTGEPLTPEATVTLGDRTLAANTDYTVEYAGNVNVGTAKVTIIGKGNYKGYIEKEFEIIKLPTALTITALPKLQYEVGEQFDFNGGKLRLEYSDLSAEEITFADAAVTGFDSDIVGPQKVTATYEGLSVTLSVSVSEKEKIVNIVPPEVNGVYQLSTPEHLFWFITQVNNGNTKINADMVQDIVINKDCLSRLSLSKKETEEFNLIEWQPIGTPENPYEGTFNGQGHTVSGLYVNSNTEDNVGLFGTVAEEGTIKNVGVVDSYLKGDKNVGSVCGSNEGTVVNCYNTSIIQGNDNVGGITGSITKEGVVANSYSVGKATTTAGEEKGVSGVASENVQNCYYLTTSTDNTDTQARTAAEFKSGEVAKSLVEGAKTLAEEKGDDQTFVLEVFNIDNVLPGVEDIKEPEDPEDPEDPTTPVSEVTESNVSIWSYANTIFVENADEDIYVVSLSGVTVKKVSPESSRIEIGIQNPGIYIVKTGKISKKVLIQ